MKYVGFSKGFIIYYPQRKLNKWYQNKKAPTIRNFLSIKIHLNQTSSKVMAPSVAPRFAEIFSVFLKYI